MVEARGQEECKGREGSKAVPVPSFLPWWNGKRVWPGKGMGPLLGQNGQVVSLPGRQWEW